MKRIAGLLILLALLLLTSCESTRATLVASPEKKTETYLQGSRLFSARSDGDVQMIVGLNEYEGRKASFSISIASTKDGGTFNFQDGDIAIYGGNKDKKKWELIKTWSSTDAIRSARIQANAAVVATGILGTLAVVDSILSGDDYYTDINYSYGYHYGSYTGHRHGSGVYIESNDPFFTALTAIEATVAVSQLTNIYEDEYNDKLLSCPVSTPVNSVSGEIFFSSLPKYADYKLVFNNGKQKIEFFFSRTDREEILHPWRDKDTDLISIGYTYSPELGRHNMDISYLSPDFFGGYTGVSVYQKFSDTDLYRGVGINVGLNFKAADYTWIKAGVDFTDVSNDDKLADILTTGGLQFVVNGISLYGGAVYSTTENRWFGEFGVGTAF